VQQFRMVRQELLDRMLDQGLHCHAAQHGGKLELRLFRFGNAGALGGLDQDHARFWRGHGCYFVSFLGSNNDIL